MMCWPHDKMLFLKQRDERIKGGGEEFVYKGKL